MSVGHERRALESHREPRLAGRDAGPGGAARRARGLGEAAPHRGRLHDGPAAARPLSSSNKTKSISETARPGIRARRADHAELASFPTATASDHASPGIKHDDDIGRISLSRSAVAVEHLIVGESEAHVRLLSAR